MQKTFAILSMSCRTYVQYNKLCRKFAWQRRGPMSGKYMQKHAKTENTKINTGYQKIPSIKGLFVIFS
jgi:hypothetical protein